MSADKKAQMTADENPRQSANKKSAVISVFAEQTMNPFNIIKKPVITEKATKLKEKENKYEFIVAKHSTKGQIKEAIEQLFDVDVEKIRTAILPGKLRRMGAHAGHRPDFKKALVNIKKGQTIKIVEGV